MIGQQKPVVSFGNLVALAKAGGGGQVAILGNIANHPRLGDEPLVRTSLVERTEKNEEGRIVLIETRNTVYKYDAALEDKEASTD